MRGAKGCVEGFNCRTTTRFCADGIALCMPDPPSSDRQTSSRASVTRVSSSHSCISNNMVDLPKHNVVQAEALEGLAAVGVVYTLFLFSPVNDISLSICRLP